MTLQRPPDRDDAPASPTEPTGPSGRDVPDVPAPALLARASGIGSWPGVDPLEAARTVLGELGTAPGLPHVVELPGRGPGAELVGRAASLLVELPVDLQPSGWRLTDHPGRDAERARSLLRSDLDALAEAAEGYTGPLKVQVAGPWTLAASLRLPRGERSVVDPGARRDVTASLAEGLAVHLADVARTVPGAALVVQLDEPSLPAVLAGRLPTASGFGRLPAVPAEKLETGLREVLEVARSAGAGETLVHCCAEDVPLAVLRGSGADGVAVDLSRLGAAGWESVALGVEEGQRLWAGVVPTGSTGRTAVPGVAALADGVRGPWRRVGLPLEGLADVVVTPACGLAGSAPATARDALRRVVEVADALAETAAG